MAALLAQLELLPHALAGHLAISVIPLCLGVLLSLPLGVAIAGRPARGPVLVVVGVIQTIPGLALLALMVPLLVALGDLLAPIGVSVPALGPLPVGIALTLYAMLPVVRNTVTGIEGVDPGVVEAAVALGMTGRQVLRQVQLPLAAPVILAGVRTAAVWVVGLGTLATPVGQPSLGSFIFAGLQTRDPLAVVVGCVGAAALALVVDGALAVVERAARRRRGRPAALALGGLAVLVAGGMALPALDGGGGGVAVVVGGKPFTEQYVLTRLIEAELADAGFAVDRRDGLGSTVLLDALLAGEVDVAVDYTGTLWANHLGRTDTAGAADVLDAVCGRLAEESAACVGALGFENAYAVAVRRGDAETRGWRTLADLARDAPELSFGADYEFLRRPEWAAVRRAYGLSFRAETTFDPTFLYEAVATRRVDAISAYTSDGRIAAFDLAVLDDPADALPPYDAVLLVSGDAPVGVVEALRPLVGAIDVGRMRAANQAVDIDGRTPAEAARLLQESRAPGRPPDIDVH